MKSYLFIFLMVFVVACSTSDDEVDAVNSLSIEFKPDMGATRATDTNFETSDDIGVFAFKNTEAFSGNTYAQNVKYVYNGTHFTAISGISYPSTGEGLSFYAVYPYSGNVLSSQFNFTVSSDQSGSNYTQSDLMTASTGITTVETPDLKFSHRLSSIVVNIRTTGQTITGNSSFSIDADRYASVDLFKNVFSASSGNTGSIKAAANGTNSFKLILPPQQIAAGIKFGRLEVNGVSYTWTTKQTMSLKSGMRYTFDLTIDERNHALILDGEADHTIEDVVPPSILDKMKPYITIYNGSNPPNIEGTYLINPMVAVFCEDGMFQPGEEVVGNIIKFANQNNTNLTLDYAEKDVEDGSGGQGNGAFISGSGNDFTAYFDVEGTSLGIYYKTALVISGTKVSNGLQNLRYAFVMVDKGSDPEGELMDVGIFRIFRDQDELATYSNWRSTRGFGSKGNSHLCKFPVQKKE